MSEQEESPLGLFLSEQEESPLNLFLSDQVRLTCEATVAGERLAVSQVVVAEAYEDPGVRRHLEEAVRRKLMDAILEKWTPVIRVER